MRPSKQRTSFTDRGFVQKLKRVASASLMSTKVAPAAVDEEIDSSMPSAPPCLLRMGMFALAVTPVVAWLTVITCVVATAGGDDAGPLGQSIVTGPGLVLAYVLCEILMIHARSCGALLWLSVRLRAPLSALAVHAVVAWYGVVRLLDEPSTLQVVHVVLVYLALLLLTLRTLVAPSSGSARVAELEAELRESRVQYDAMCALLRKRHGGDDLEESSELEGDEREHLIVPPMPMVVSEEALGRPELALPETLQGRLFDRALALKVATRIRKRSYNLAAFYQDT